MNGQFAPLMVGLALGCLVLRMRARGMKPRPLPTRSSIGQLVQLGQSEKSVQSVRPGPLGAGLKRDVHGQGEHAPGGRLLKSRESSSSPARGLVRRTGLDRTLQFRTPTGVRRWIKRNTISMKVAPLALGIITLVLVPTIAPALWLCVVGLGRVRKRRAFQQLRARQSAALPDLVDMIRLCVASGCTPYGSLVVLGSLPLHADDVLGPLLVEAAEALRGGAVVGEVLEEFQSVVGDAARPLCSALRSSAESGTPITETLDLLAREARRARKAQADVAAKRLPVLLLFPLITCILPAFALLAIVPLLGGALSALHW